MLRLMKLYLCMMRNPTKIPHVDTKSTGYGPGTPMQVIEIFRGAPTDNVSDGEPRMLYKFAAQYETWYPTDCPERIRGFQS